MMSGCFAMPKAPVNAIITNQTAVIGLNHFATPAVPRLWNKNSTMRIAHETGTTMLSTFVFCSTESPWISFNPSTAPNTDMTGVIIPSP